MMRKVDGQGNSRNGGRQETALEGWSGDVRVSSSAELAPSLHHRLREPLLHESDQLAGEQSSSGSNKKRRGEREARPECVSIGIGNHDQGFYAEGMDQPQGNRRLEAERDSDYTLKMQEGAVHVGARHRDEDTQSRWRWGNDHPSSHAAHSVGRGDVADGEAAELAGREAADLASSQTNGVHVQEQCPDLPLVNCKGGLNVEQRGFPKLKSYWADLFHTLINMPHLRFFPLLLVAYALLFGLFAIPYYHQSLAHNCIPGVRTYWHAVWFSVQSSMTIGYGGDLTPDPDCIVVNSVITIQSLASLVVAYSLLGVVYARFALPTRRAFTIVFSRHMLLYEEDGIPRLACRVANVRKHQVIEVHARMLVTLNNVMSNDEESIFRFKSLPVLGGSEVFLGLPCIVAHPITKKSLLHGMTVEMMKKLDMEFLILLNVVDASTSANVEARHSYRPHDIKVNHTFSTMVYRLPSGRRRVDFTKFDEVRPIQPTNVPSLISRLPRTPSYDSLRHLPLPSILETPRPIQANGRLVASRDWSGDDSSHSRSSRNGNSSEQRVTRSCSMPTRRSSFRKRERSTARLSVNGHKDDFGSEVSEEGREQRGGVLDRASELRKEAARRETRLLLENSSSFRVASQNLEVEFKHKISSSLEHARKWRDMAVRLATLVSSSSSVHSSNAECHTLLDRASFVLRKAQEGE